MMNMTKPNSSSRFAPFTPHRKQHKIRPELQDEYEALAERVGSEEALRIMQLVMNYNEIFV